MALQNVILPCVYCFWRIIFFNSQPSLIILADSHHSTVPYSMENIYRELTHRGYSVTLEICDYTAMTAFQSFLRALRFMRKYANAKYVFICDNFLPAVSCHKRKETTVIQLWHASGLLKKMGYDAKDDIPPGYRGHVYKNYDLVTVSAPCCIKPMANAMHLPEEIVRPLGVSRTDNYFDPVWRDQCKEDFYSRFPELKGKKLILWAPTFRGNAGDPYQVGTEDMQRVAEYLGNEYFIIRKVHPYVDAKYHLSNCPIQTERLFPVIDLLISDYSSVVCEFMAFRKPYILFAPDLEKFTAERGFYVPYSSLSPYVSTDWNTLCSQIQTAMGATELEWTETCRQYHLASCDGKATQRILDYLGLCGVCTYV